MSCYVCWRRLIKTRQLMINRSANIKRYLAASDFDQTLSFNDSGPADHIFGSQLEYDDSTGEICAIKRVSAGYGKIAVLVPIFEDILDWSSAQIREAFESYGLAIQEWDKTRTDW